MPVHHRPGAPQAAAVRAALAPVVDVLGLTIEDVVLVAAGSRRVLRVVIDVDPSTPMATGAADDVPAVLDGPSLDDIAEASRSISAALDAEDVMGTAAYTLEVTTPGVDRPLVEPRHFARNVGRLVLVTMDDGTTVQGRVRSAGAALELVVAGAKGVQQAREIGWEHVVRGAVQVEFNRPTGRSGRPADEQDAMDDSNDEEG